MPKLVIKEDKPDLELNEQVASRAETTDVKDSSASLGFGSYMHDSDESVPTTGQAGPDADTSVNNSMGMEDFQGFNDPLAGMDLGDFPNLGQGRTNGESGDWGQIQNLIGGDPPEQRSEPVESADVSVAPPLDQATRQTQADTELDQGLPQDEESVRAVAAAAEGETAVPPSEPQPILGEADASASASGVPTEAVSEMPATDLPPTVEEPAMPSSDGTVVEGAENDSNDLFGSNSPADVALSTEADKFGEVIDAATAPSPKAPQTNEVVPEGPAQSVNMPEGTTDAPAHDASVEAPATGEADSTAVDAV